MRAPVVLVGLGVLLVAIIVAGLLFLAGRTHHGTGRLPQAAPKATPHQIDLCNSCAHDYNPDALSGPKNQHPNQVGLAIDGNRNAAWTTETYDGDELGKPGVGIYVDAQPGVASGSMILDTSTPGFAVTIYARSSPPNANVFDTGPNGWVKVGAAPDVHPTQTIELATGGVPYRYYLVWITSLGEHGSVAVNEIALYT
jgi:hypothetical protein